MKQTITSLDQLSSLLQSSNVEFFYMKNGIEFDFTRSKLLSTSLFEILRLINDGNLYIK